MPGKVGVTREASPPDRRSSRSAVAAEAFVNNAGESEGLCLPTSASQSETEPFALLTENIQQITTNGLSRDIATSGRVFSTMEKRNMALIGCWKSPPACLVHLVCSVCLVCLVYSVEQDQLDEPDKPHMKSLAFLSILPMGAW